MSRQQRGFVLYIFLVSLIVVAFMGLAGYAIYSTNANAQVWTIKPVVSQSITSTGSYTSDVFAIGDASFFAFQMKCTTTNTAGNPNVKLEWLPSSEESSAQAVEPTFSGFGDLSTSSTIQTWTPVTPFYPPVAPFAKVKVSAYSTNNDDLSSCDVILNLGD